MIPVMLLLGGAVIISVVGHILFEYTGLPESVFMIILGVISGPILNIITPTGLEPILPHIFTISILVILLESGLETQFIGTVDKMRDASIFTFIVLIVTSLLVGAFMYFFIGWEPLHSLLLGVICSGTSTLPVIYFTSRMSVNEDVKTLLVYESILNDVTLLTAVTLILQAMTMNINVGSTLVNLARHIFLAVMFGSIVAFIWASILIKFFREVYLRYISTLSVLTILYAITEMEKASGVLAALTFSLILGGLNDILKNSGLFYKRTLTIFDPLESQLKSIVGMQREISFVVKNLFFLIMGIMFDLKSLNWNVMILAILLMTLMAVSRIISVGLISQRDGRYWNDILIISLMLPRGVTASLAAFMPFEMGVTIPLLKEIIVVLVMVTTITATLGFIILEKGSGKRTT
ncbi:cation:proton antiporter [bacterium]|nr:cation:proton antiporter [bacterium]